MTVLFIVADSGSLTTREGLIRDRLEDTFGYTVTLISDSDVSSSSVDAYDFGVVSYECNHADIDTLKSSTKPIMVNAFGKWAELSLADVDGTFIIQTTVYIREDHPLSAGFAVGSTISVYDVNNPFYQVADSALGAGVESPICKDSAQTNNNMLFCYKKGSTLADSSTAAGYRIAFGFRDVDEMTTDGWAFFDASINELWQIFSYTGSGTGALSGSGVTSVSFSFTGSGGSVLGGSADTSFSESQTFSYIGTGYITCNGGGAVTSYDPIFIFESSGGISLSGIGITKVEFISVPTGGVLLSGSGGTSYIPIYKNIGSGSIDIEGGGNYILHIPFIAIGGIYCFGSFITEYIPIYEYASQGGVVLGGSGISKMEYSSIGSGVAVLSGSSNTGIVFSYTAVYEYEPITIDGIAITEIDDPIYEYTAQGEVSVSGTVVTNCTYKGTVLGGEIDIDGSGVTGSRAFNDDGKEPVIMDADNSLYPVIMSANSPLVPNIRGAK